MIRTAPKKAPPKKRGRPPSGKQIADQFNEQSLPNFTEQSFVDWYAALPPEKLEALMNHKPKRGRPASGKIMITIRLDPDIVARFKADGPGWQARINEALRKAVILPY